MNHAVATALYSKLTGAEAVTKLLGASTGVYDQEAPPEAKYPLVIFGLNTGSHEYTFSERAWRDQLWLVKAVDRSSSAKVANEIDAAIDTLLTDGTLSISGASLMSMRRKMDMPPYTEIKDGVMHRHVGGLYRINFQ